MLKITSHTTQAETTLRLEGRLTGPWVDELEQAWRSRTPSGNGVLVIDLRGVTFIDEKGKALLEDIWRDGAELIAAGCCTTSMIERFTGSRKHTASHRSKNG